MIKYGLIILCILSMNMCYGQLNTYWLQKKFFKCVSLAILDFRMTESPFYTPFQIEPIEKPIPLSTTKTGNPKFDSVLKNAYLVPTPYQERFFYVINITYLDTVNFKLEFNITNRSFISEKFDTTLNLYMSFNNYHLFISFKNSNDKILFSSVENVIEIDRDFLHNRNFSFPGLYCGSPQYCFFSVDKYGIVSNKYNNFYQIPVRLQKKTIAYSHYLQDLESD